MVWAPAAEATAIPSTASATASFVFMFCSPECEPWFAEQSAISPINARAGPIRLRRCETTPPACAGRVVLNADQARLFALGRQRRVAAFRHAAQDARQGVVPLMAGVFEH